MATLFDIRGRRVRTVYPGPVYPGRPLTFPLDAGGLPDGVYLLRIDTPYGAARAVVVMR